MSIVSTRTLRQANSLRRRVEQAKPASRGTEPRLGALDALRGAAMLLGVVLHAAISYMPSRMPGLAWGVYETETNRFFDVVFWGIHGFRLPLFFVIAGFFTALVYESRGPHELLAQRARRLLIPFVAGSLIILPISFYITACGWLVTERCTLREILRVKFGPDIQEHLYGPAHLWFLEDLILMSVAYCLVRWLSGKGDRNHVREIASERLGICLLRPFLLAVPTALVLWFDLAPVVNHHNSFIPSPMRLVYYGIFFAAGTALHARRQWLVPMLRFSTLHLALAVFATGTMLVLLDRQLAGDLQGFDRVGLAMAISLAAWLSVFGLLGVFLRRFNSQHPAIRYVADASYWIYLVHLPIVALVQVDLFSVALPSELKFAIVVLLTTTLGFITYHACVRYTLIGTTLNGRRERPSRMPAEGTL